jgi:hypothetical protein
MRIEIPSWDKYNPRNDAKKWSWFRFENDFFDDESLCDLSGLQRLLLVYLFTRRNKAATLIFTFNPRHAAQRVDASPEEVIAAAQAIAKAGIIRIHPDPQEPETYADVRERTDTYVDERIRTLRTDGRTDDTDDTDDTRQVEDPETYADRELAEKWADYAKSVTPSLKVNIAKWTDAVRLLRTRDKLPRVELARMLEFVQGDDFWKDKALSIEGLRKEGRNGLRKFENIRNRMRETPGSVMDDWDEWAAKMEAEAKK